jgi:hypothetical protein
VLFRSSLPKNIVTTINEIIILNDTLKTDVETLNTITLKLKDEFENLYEVGDDFVNDASFDFDYNIVANTVLVAADIKFGENNDYTCDGSGSPINSLNESDNICQFKFNKDKPFQNLAIKSDKRGSATLTFTQSTQSNSNSNNNISKTLDFKFYDTPPAPIVLVVRPEKKDTLLQKNKLIGFKDISFEIKHNTTDYTPGSLLYRIDDEDTSRPYNERNDSLNVSLQENETSNLTFSLSHDSTSYWLKSNEFSIPVQVVKLDTSKIFPKTGTVSISTYPTFSTAFNPTELGNNENVQNPNLKVLLDKGNDAFISFDPDSQYELRADNEYSWYTCLESDGDIIGACSEAFTFKTRKTVNRHIGITHEFKKDNSELFYRLLAFPFNQPRKPSEFLTGESPYDWRAFDIDFNENELSFKPGNSLWVISKNSFEIPVGFDAATPDEQDVREITVNNDGWSSFSLPFLTNDPITVNEIATFNDNIIPDSLRIYEWIFNIQDWVEVNSNSKLKPMTVYVIKVESNQQPAPSTLELNIPYTSLEKRSLQTRDTVLTKEIFLSAVFDDATTSRILLTETSRKSQIPDFGNPKTDFALSPKQNNDKKVLYSTYPMDSVEDDIQLVTRSEIFNRVKLKLEGENSSNYALLLMDEEGNVRYHVTSDADLPLTISDKSSRFNLKLIGLDELNELLEAELPTETALMQNYPNPFNPSTQIRFSLTTDSPVKIQIFDLLGRSVTTLVNEELKAGWHSVVMNNSTLSSGVYLYTMSTPDYRFTRKMTLIK